MDSRISPGAWVNTRFGEAVVTQVDEPWVYYRYHAVKYTVDTTREIWVSHGDNGADLRFLRAADDVAAYVLTLEGPYGEGIPLPPVPPAIEPVGPIRAVRAEWAEVSRLTTDTWLWCYERHPDPDMDRYDQTASAHIFQMWDQWIRDTLRVRLEAVGWTVDEYEQSLDAIAVAFDD